MSGSEKDDLLARIEQDVEQEIVVEVRITTVGKTKPLTISALRTVGRLVHSQYGNALVRTPDGKWLAYDPQHTLTEDEM